MKKLEKGRLGRKYFTKEIMLQLGLEGFCTLEDKKSNFGLGKIALWIKVLATKLDLSLSPRTHRVEEK